MSGTEPRQAGECAPRWRSRAQDHTQAMLDWWSMAVHRVDVAVRRPSGVMIWHLETELTGALLAWARAENAVHHADVYARPARGHAWPLVLLDDVDPALASGIARKYAALVIRTSPPGGCQVWLRCARALDEHERCGAQRWLADRVLADRASISGEHLGRLAGFKNCKRSGVWVNVERASTGVPAWDPEPALSAPRHASDRVVDHRDTRTRGDRSESGREWGWACGAIAAGCPAGLVYARLLERAVLRRGRDAPRYVRQTVDRALLHVAASLHRR